jgi:phosphoglycolate phosphatase-like HAD superfamily hydrolase
MLILFDIDGTLLRTEGAGIAAMADAGRELFGPELVADGIPIAGRLDPLIMGDMLARIGLEPTAARMAVFRSLYGQRLAQRLTPGCQGVRAMPGVIEIVSQLRAIPEQACLGLLTGNFSETAAMKLRACGLNPDHFGINAWGDDSGSTPPTRDDLPAVAMERYRAARGKPIAGERVVIIGDTPHDVRCAKAHGCRCLGVATGKSSVAELDSAGADWAVQDLAQTRRVLDWLMEIPR